MSAETIQRPIRKEKEIEFYKPTLSREDLKGVLECLVDEHLASGQIVERFEKTFCHTFKTKYSVSTNSLTSAYHLVLLALGVKAGDSVLLSSFAPISALDAIFLIQAKPVLVDLKKNSFHPDPEEFLKKKTEFDIKYAIFHHNFGCLVNLSQYQTEGMDVIEDFTEAIGASSETILVGRQSKVSICGLSAENMITTGNGAMILTQDQTVCQSIKSWKTGAS
ncbi:MAG: DegT/DnrJ/EryC1/StrS family aminotransferase, partial [Leptospira sp.]|nr:DegT/DnrJ/EryC1/StrS family aminotransferase [Leptospira sp.]